MKKYVVKNKEGKYLTMIGMGNWGLVASKDMRYTFDTEKQAEMAAKMAKGQKDKIKDEDLEVVAEGMRYIKTYESFLYEGARIDTTPYKSVHTKEPKGFGLWYFSFSKDGSDPMSPEKSMSYGDAIIWAQQQAKEKNQHIIYVLG